MRRTTHRYTAAQRRHRRLYPMLGALAMVGILVAYGLLVEAFGYLPS
jgi:hypothetical protein